MLLELLVKGSEITSPEANTNVWIFIVSTICCVLGFFAVQIWLQSGKLNGIKSNYEILKSQVDIINTKVDGLNLTLNQFLKQEIDFLKEVSKKK